jgi:hypothetical protein
MAAPHVTGTVALCIYSGACAGLTPSQIIQQIRSDAAAYNTAHPSYGFTGDPLHPVSGRYYGFLLGIAPPEEDAKWGGPPGWAPPPMGRGVKAAREIRDLQPERRF